MKNLSLSILLLLPLFSLAQSVGIGTQTPNASAMLDVSSTSKGLLIPRMTEEQKNIMANPATGLLIWQTDNTPGFYYNGGTPEGPKWYMLSVAADTDWKLAGNNNVDPANHFIGTTNKQPINFRINNTWAGQLDSGKATMFGYEAGWQNESNSNTGFGQMVLYTNSNGFSNTGVGYKALYANRSGNNNVAVGSRAAEDNIVGSRITALGSWALRRNSTGNSNTGLGAFALENNTVGDSNLAVGPGSVRYNTEGSKNTGVGVNALQYVKYNDNTALGYEALGSLQTGSWNVAVGSKALQKLGYGSNNGNTAVGYQAIGNNNYTWNSALGYRALYNNLEGAGNTAIGSNAMDGNIDGEKNTALGYYSEVANGGKENATVLGWRSYAECSNCLILGSVNGKNNSNVTVNVGIGTTDPQFRLQVGMQGDGTVARANSWTTFSDERYKKDIITIDGALDKIDYINGYYYNWKNGEDKTRQAGLLAQEVEEVLPEIVSTDSEGYKSVDYGKMNALLLQAVKELKAQNEALIKAISELNNQKK